MLRLRVSFSFAFLVLARAIQVSTGCIGFWGGAIFSVVFVPVLVWVCVVLGRGSPIGISGGISAPEGGWPPGERNRTSTLLRLCHNSPGRTLNCLALFTSVLSCFSDCGCLFFVTSNPNLLEP
jgi:Na+/melibiose symporter-like transporter